MDKIPFDSTRHISIRDFHTQLNEKFPDDRNWGLDWVFRFCRQQKAKIFRVLSPAPQWKGQEIRVISTKDAARLSEIFISDYETWKAEKDDHAARQKRIDADWKRRLASRNAEEAAHAKQVVLRREIDQLENEMHRALAGVREEWPKEKQNCATRYRMDVDKAMQECLDRYNRGIQALDVMIQAQVQEIEVEYAEKIAEVESRGEE